MKRHLHEAVEDLELAVLKAMSRASLTLKETQALNELSVRDLMADHGLDYILAECVVKHVQHEMLRFQSQNLMTPLEDSSFGFTSLTRSSPTPQKPLGLSESRIRNIVRKVVEKTKNN